MKTMSKLIISLTIGIIVVISSGCKKTSLDEALISPVASLSPVTDSSNSGVRDVSTHKLKVVLCKDGYKVQLDSVFIFSTDYQTAKIGSKRVIDIFDDAMYSIHQQLHNGEDGMAYKFPFAIIDSNGDGIIYGYPDYALQHSATFSKFKTWFESKTKGWINAHECIDCSNVTTLNSTPQYFKEIDCDIISL